MGDAFYLPADGELRQGDVAFAQISQVVPRKPQRDWPGATEPDGLPSYGDYDELDGPLNEHGFSDYRVRVWTTRVIVLTQGCELKRAHDQDSRVVVAPIIGETAWDSPDLWRQVKSGVLVPGFHYLPTLSEVEAEALGLNVDDLGPAVVDLAAASLASREMISRRRIARIAPERLVDMQDAVARAFTVRGLASTRELSSLEGRRIMSSHETGLVSPGPVRLVKIHLSGKDETPEDEVTVAWGLRDALPVPPEPDTGVGSGEESVST